MRTAAELTSAWPASLRPRAPPPSRSSALGWVEAVPFFDFALVKQMFPVLLTFYGSVRPPPLPSPRRKPPGADRRRNGRSSRRTPPPPPPPSQVYSNMKVLQHANVETFIVFRSITPLIVCVADAFFRPHVASLPSGRTALSLFTIFLGAAGYTALDSTFTATSYGWGALYVTIFCVEMVYGV